MHLDCTSRLRMDRGAGLSHKSAMECNSPYVWRMCLDIDANRFVFRDNRLVKRFTAVESKVKLKNLTKEIIFIIEMPHFRFV